MKGTTAALELSANVVVIMIVGIVIVGLGLSLFFGWIGSVEDFKDQIDSQTQQQIEALLSQGQKVAVPFALQHAAPGKTASFGLGVRNNWEADGTQDFILKVSTDSYADRNKQEQPYENWQQWTIQYSQEAFTLSKGNTASKLILITLPKDASTGTYIFNAQVCTTAATGMTSPACPEGYAAYGLAKLYVENP